MKICYDKLSYKWVPFKVVRAYVLVVLVLSLIGPVQYDYDFLYAFFMNFVYYCIPALNMARNGKGKYIRPAFIMERDVESIG